MPLSRASELLAEVREGFAFTQETILATQLGDEPELIGEALVRLGRPASDCVMIGDRRMDIDGARHHRMRSVGVRWGFGDADELAQADVHVDHPRDLLRLL